MEGIIKMYDKWLKLDVSILRDKRDGEGEGEGEGGGRDEKETEKVKRVSYWNTKQERREEMYTDYRSR